MQFSDVHVCRFWWRDTRLSELTVLPPPTLVQELDVSSSSYQFPYPSTLIAIPCHMDTTLAHIQNILIPLARTSRQVPIAVPAASSGTMDMDDERTAPAASLQSVTAEVKSDGMLLYVSQSTYEPGTNPLSTWVPIRPYTDHGDATSTREEGPLDRFARLGFFISLVSTPLTADLTD